LNSHWLAAVSFFETQSGLAWRTLFHLLKTFDFSLDKT